MVQYQIRYVRSCGLACSAGPRKTQLGLLEASVVSPETPGDLWKTCRLPCIEFLFYGTHGKEAMYMHRFFLWVSTYTANGLGLEGQHLQP